jgi:hypothetical protein
MRRAGREECDNEGFERASAERGSGWLGNEKTPWWCCCYFGRGSCYWSPEDHVTTRREYPKGKGIPIETFRQGRIWKMGSSLSTWDYSMLL